MIDWAAFFPPETPVIALPNWEAPRLFIPASRAAQRWKKSAFYPAFRFRARLFRVALRLCAASSVLVESKIMPGHTWSLLEFTGDAVPHVDAVSVLVGTAGPAQKITAQLWNRRQQVVGYLKYAEKPRARARLRQEQEVLTQLPAGCGPRSLKYGAWQNGEALLTTPLQGTALPASLPPPDALARYGEQLVVAPPMDLSAHPWVERHSQYTEVAAWLAVLSSRQWPVVVQHGDLVSWNMRRQQDGSLAAFDWEYGSLQGFPLLDAVYFVLQLGALIYRWPPARARSYAVTYLTQTLPLSLTEREAAALVSLAAFDAYRKSSEDETDQEAPLQQWRRAIWESTT